jgi:Fe2+ or Zn2+ uptake regulation protein
MNIRLELPLPLRDQGRHLTRQRQLVLDILRAHPEHLDAGSIYAEAKKQDDRISLATVYRSLAFLQEAGLIEENRLGEDHGHFEAVQESRHYHFTCLGCGRVVEFEAAEIATIVEALEDRRSLQVTEIQFHLQGFCPDCQKTN